ncbi:MAG: endolytic transglycosylase MltG [Rhizobiales bacterium]|nr:endolytic transglycosylase MltG [Hyphomicrobiales bacterium]
MTLESDRPGSFGRRAEVPEAATSTQPAAGNPAPAQPVERPAENPAPAKDKVAAPAKRSRASRSQFVVFLNFLVSLIFVATLAAFAVAWFGKSAFEAPGPSTTNQTVLVKPNSGVQEIADLLERRGLITDARIFLLGSRAFGGGGTMKAGEYEIKAGASMREIMDVLKSGKSILYSLTIPEGLTVEQALDRIRASDLLSGDMPATIPEEGSLAADTQRFTRGTKREDIVNKLIADQKALVKEIWDSRASDLPIADINEFVTLASIVEKETGIASERPHVASVFVNRLNKNMRLQSDPTVIYGIYGGKGKPADKPITQSDLKKQTPYNTYVINGLPPTPIANPGRAALEAVANPAQTDDLYFVADGTGGHVFAKTLDEHNDNVARWRAAEKKKAGQGTPDDGDDPDAE